MTNNMESRYRLIELAVEIHAQLSQQRYRQLHELLGQPPGRHKAWTEHYVFDLGTDRLLGDRVLAYLRAERLAHTVIGDHRWEPDG